MNSSHLVNDFKNENASEIISGDLNASKILLEKKCPRCGGCLVPLSDTSPAVPNLPHDPVRGRSKSQDNFLSNARDHSRSRDETNGQWRSRSRSRDLILSHSRSNSRSRETSRGYNNVVDGNYNKETLDRCNITHQKHYISQQHFGSGLNSNNNDQGLGFEAGPNNKAINNHISSRENQLERERSDYLDYQNTSLPQYTSHDQQNHQLQSQGKLCGNLQAEKEYDIRGWRCTQCDFTIQQAALNVNMDSSDKKEEVTSSQETAEEDIEDNKDQSIDEEYKIWETQVNKDFSEFLQHIKEYFTEKEHKLKEYQIDLCQREKSLKSNEGYFTERMDTLKKAEEEFQDKVERLNLQVQDRMQRLREYEARITRINASQKNKMREISTQTVISTPNEFFKGTNSNKQASHNNGNNHYYTNTFFGRTFAPNNGSNSSQQTRKNIASVRPNRERLAQIPQPQVPVPTNVQNGVHRSYENASSSNHSKTNNPNTVIDGDYMYMGDVQKYNKNMEPLSKENSPKDSIAGSPYYMDITQVSRNKDITSDPNSSPLTQTDSSKPDVVHDVNNSNGTNTIDSGFITPDPEIMRSNPYYTYYDRNDTSISHNNMQPLNNGVVVVDNHISELQPKLHHITENSSNNSNNISPNDTNSGSSTTNRMSDNSPSYYGERAVLVKNPNGVDSYTSKAHSYTSSAIHRSSSLPQRRGSRSPSPERVDRSKSMPPEPEPDAGNMMDYSKPHRPLSEDVLSKHSPTLDGENSPDSQKSNGGSMGSKPEDDDNHKNLRVYSSATSVYQRQPRDRRPKNVTECNNEYKEYSDDSNKDSQSTVRENTFGFRSRSSESVQRNVFGYRQQKQVKLIEARKKAQSDLNLSSEKWNEEPLKDNYDEDVVISHKKSTSFDSPRNKDFLQHEVHFRTTFARTEPIITDTYKVEISSGADNSRFQSSDYNQVSNQESHKPISNNSYVPGNSDEVVNKPPIEKPRVRGRRSDMSMPHRKLNKISYYTASGTHLNPQPHAAFDSKVMDARNYTNSYSEQIQMINAKKDNNTHAYQNSYNNNSGLSTFKGVYRKPPVAVKNINYSVPENRNHTYQNVQRPSNDASPSYSRSQDYSHPVYTPYVENPQKQSSNEYKTKESPDMTSTPRELKADHVYPNYGAYSKSQPQPSRYYQAGSQTNGQSSNNFYPRGYSRDKGNRYAQTEQSDANFDLSDKSTWALKRRRDVKRSPDGNNNSQAPVTPYTHSQPKQAENTASNDQHDYVNVYPNIYSSQSGKEVSPAQNNAYSNLEFKNSAENNVPSDHRNMIPIRNGKTISYIPPENVAVNEQQAKTEIMINNKNLKYGSKAHIKKKDTYIDDNFLSGENNQQQNKKKSFGFSPKYKEILFKYGGAKNSGGEKSSPSKKNKQTPPSPNTAATSTSRFGFKSKSPSAEKDKHKKDKISHSASSKVPQYSSYVYNK